MQTSRSAQVLVLHAYSARNNGDGFLVSATVGLLRAAGVGSTDIAVAASDSESFPQLNTVQLPFFTGQSSASALQAVVATAIRGATGNGLLDTRLANAINSARLIVAVGGGYLRAGSIGEQIRTGLVHYPQLLAASQSDVPTIYLPQSIGPLRYPLGPLVRRSLAKITSVCVRDERTIDELRGLPNVRRVPDLAALDIGTRFHTLRFRRPERVVLVARGFTGTRERPYVRRLGELSRLLGNPEMAVQSTVGGNDDDAFYRRHVPGANLVSSQEVFAGQPAVVISVRLHGALMAMMAGHPAIHLSYERKGWGAYEDLGLTPFVHNAFTFEPAHVAKQVRALMKDPDEYWARVSAKVTSLTKHRSDIVRLIDNCLDRRKRACAS